MPNLGPMEWILILLVLILLFGAKKLPDTAKALGQSLRLFKKETSKMSDEDEARQTVQAQAEPVTRRRRRSRRPPRPSRSGCARSRRRTGGCASPSGR